MTEESGKQKGCYRREKPWDTEDVDKWKLSKFTPEDNPHSLLEQSSFSTLFPQYREKYLKDVWGEIKGALASHHIEAELNCAEGTITVRTTDKTYDPYIIIKARDMIKLLARSVPVKPAAQVLQDGIFCDIIKIGGLVRNKDIFVKRRQRLVGPNASTLKAIELLSECYVLVQGQTVSAIGAIKGLKAVRRIVVDCMANIHPVYHVKELMIRRELEKDPELKKESWDRFLPHFRKRNLERRKRRKVVIKKKKPAVFPPDQTPRKEDIALETGEYFVSAADRQQKKKTELGAKQVQTKEDRKRERGKQFDPSLVELRKKQQKKRRLEESEAKSGPDLSSSAAAVAAKFSAKAKKSKAT